MIKKSLVVLAAILATTAALAGCSSAGGGSSTGSATDAGVTLTKDVHLVVGTSAQEGAFFTDSGVFDDVPYTIDWSYITNWGAIYSSIASNALNVGYWGLDANIFKAYQNGVPAQLVALLGDTSANPEAGPLDVFVRTDAGIDSPADLAGKTIATGSAGTTFDNVLSAALEAGGLTQDDVNITRYSDSDQTSQISALLDGSAQAFAGNIASQQVIDALDAGTIKVLYWQDQALPVNRIVVSNTQTLSDPAQTAALADFVQRVAKTAYWQNDTANKDKWVSIESDTTGLPSATSEAVWGYNQGSALPLPLDDDTTATLSDIQDDFVSWGLLTSPVALSDILDTRFSSQIQSVIDSNGD